MSAEFRFPIIPCEGCGDKYPVNILNSKHLCPVCSAWTTEPTKEDRKLCAEDDKRKIEVETL
jgi:hypothetical protein